MDKTGLQDRFRGCLVGLAVGDALGAASEFMKEPEVRECYGILCDYRSANGFAAGEFTDDTSLALAIAESIIETDSIDVESISDNFIQWMRVDGRGIGNLTLDALTLIEEGMSPAQAGHRAWERSGKKAAGNGAVMRCAPVALYDWRDLEELTHDSILVSQITHYDPKCCWSCVAVNSAISAILSGEQDPLQAAVESIEGANAELESALVAAVDEDVHGMRLDGEDMGYTVLTTQAAFAALRQFGSYEDGIVAIVNKGGDADTNAAVTGALLGAKFGFSAIPKRWLEGLSDRDRVITAADGLFELVCG